MGVRSPWLLVSLARGFSDAAWRRPDPAVGMEGGVSAPGLVGSLRVTLDVPAPINDVTTVIDTGSKSRKQSLLLFYSLRPCVLQPPLRTYTQFTKR